MLRIPYVPKPYPDELFASLLTRLVLHNGTGLWRSILEEAGYGRRTISPFFHPPMQDRKLDRLLAPLGLTYTDMLRELTILPFWLAFNQATPDRFQVRLDTAGSPLTELGRLDHAGFTPGARYCPVCLTDDIDAYGEPYLHRHHQIPVATVCARHGALLRFACPACGNTVMPFNRALLRPPALRCQCGHDLSRISASAPLHLQALLDLSRFAADTLNCTEAPWTSEHVLAVLHERSPIRGSFSRFAVQLLQRAYGSPVRDQSKATVVSRWEDAGSSLRLRVTQRSVQLRAPEYCALLAAAGMTFDEFKRAVSKVEVATVPRNSMPPRAFTIGQARKELERFQAESPGRAAERLRSSSPRLFWLLRLSDSALLRAHGYLDRQAIPTIEADRARVKELQKRVCNTRNAGAWIRATIRDYAWLQAFVGVQPAAGNTQKALAQRVQRERAMALSRAVFSLLRTQNRPSRVHAGVLAKVVRITMHQAQHTIACTPALKTLIAAVNAGKDRRLAFWAARDLIEEGQSPSVNEVLQRAGLDQAQMHRQYSMDAIACFTAGHSLFADAEGHRALPKT